MEKGKKKKIGSPNPKKKEKSLFHNLITRTIDTANGAILCDVGYQWVEPIDSLTSYTRTRNTHPDLLVLLFNVERDPCPLPSSQGAGAIKTEAGSSFETMKMGMVTTITQIQILIVVVTRLYKTFVDPVLPISIW